METSPNGFDFIPGGGVVYDNGQSRWRDCLNIILDRRTAIRILSQIANWLNTASSDDEKLVLGSCGLLQKCEDGNWPCDNLEVE